MSGEHWTDERIELLKALWARGLSASQVAKQLRDTSRSAVIGKLHRLGVSNRGHAFKPAPVRIGKTGAAGLAKARAVSGTAPEPASQARPRGGILSSTRLKPMPPPPASQPIDATKAKPWTERRFGECAYPVGGEMADTLSCCLPAEGNYCPRHRAIMFVVPHTTPRSLMKMATRYAA